MRSSKAIVIAALVLVLAAGVVWVLWPASPAAPEVKSLSVQPVKMAEVMAKVEAPKIAAVAPSEAPVAKPASSVPHTLTQAERDMEDIALQEAMEKRRSVIRSQPGPDVVSVTDLGNVYLYSGVPQQIVASDGTSVTITGTKSADGKVELRVDTERYDANHKVIERSGITTVTKPGQTLTLGGTLSTTVVNGQLQTTQTSIKITPHMY